MRSFVLFALFVVLMSSGCSCRTVHPGNVGVEYSLSGSDKGDLTQRGVGWYVLGPMTEMEIFPTYIQSYTFDKGASSESPTDESFTFQTNEGQSVNTDISIQFQFREAEVTRVFQTYRRDPNAITHGILRNIIRDALNEVASHMMVEDVYGEKKNELRESVEKMVKEKLDPNGISIVSINFINAMRLPESVQTAMTAKIAATQVAMKVENELRQTEAEAKKRVAQAEGEASVARAKAEGEAGAILAMAKAQADANLMLAKSLTPELVRYRQLEILRAQSEKWDGKLPVSFGGGGSNSIIHLTPGDLTTLNGGR